MFNFLSEIDTRTKVAFVFCIMAVIFTFISSLFQFILVFACTLSLLALLVLLRAVKDWREKDYSDAMTEIEIEDKEAII